MTATELLDERPLQTVEACSRSAQLLWAETSIEERLHILRQARFLLAKLSQHFVDAMPASLPRTRADSLAAEVLPLLAACRFLEREAVRILAPRRLGKHGLPFWLAGVRSQVHRVPFGTVLVIAASNYPLFLAGVQTLQALAAGNAVVWKPGAGGWPVARIFAGALRDAGLPEGLLRVTSDSVQAAVAELDACPDKIIFTGSAQSGRAILEQASRLAIPAVVELSGCDAVIVLPSADIDRVVDALAFGMRLNGSATCMAPRRLFLLGDGHEHLLERLEQRFAGMQGTFLPAATRARLQSLLADATALGAHVRGESDALSCKPLLLRNGQPAMRIAQADLFAPVLTALQVADFDQLITQDELCPFGLTVSIFGEERTARELGAKLRTGTVLINDLIVPTADPRLPFGGRRESGFGVTRGAEGLLEMTAVKVVSVRRGNGRRHLQPTGDVHASLFEGIIAMSHRATLRERADGLRKMLSAASRLK